MAAVSEEAKQRKREQGRAYMAARRAADPEAARAKYREHYARNPERYKAKVRAWRAALDPAVARERAWRIRLRRYYGIDLPEFNALREAQAFRCAICGRHEDEIPKARPIDNSSLVVDHCHQTNKVRGLVCNPCNLVIGHAREDEAVLVAAIAYLRAFRAAES